MAVGSWTGTSPRGIYKPALDEVSGTTTTGAYKNFDTSLTNIHNKLWRDNIINANSDYGVSISSADNSTAIQNAINASNSAGGGFIFLANGEYDIASTITHKEGVILCGMGNEGTSYGTIINYTGTGRAYDLTGTLRSGGLRDITIKGSGKTPYSSGHIGLYFDDVAGHRFVLDNVRVYNFQDSAVYLNSSVYHVIFRNCHIGSAQYGLYTNSTTLTNSFDHCYFPYCVNTPTYDQGGQYFRFCYWEQNDSCTGPIVHVKGLAGGTRFVDCTIADNDSVASDAVKIENSNYVRFISGVIQKGNAKCFNFVNSSHCQLVGVLLGTTDDDVIDFDADSDFNIALISDQGQSTSIVGTDNGTHNVVSSNLQGYGVLQRVEANRLGLDTTDKLDLYTNTNTLIQATAVGTMTGHEEFTISSGNIFIKDPGGANRVLNPDGTFPAGVQITLINTADAAETITFDSNGLNQAVAQNERGIFVYDGSNWRKVYVGS